MWSICCEVADFCCPSSPFWSISAQWCQRAGERWRKPNSRSSSELSHITHTPVSELDTPAATPTLLLLHTWCLFYAIWLAGLTPHSPFIANWKCEKYSNDPRCGGQQADVTSIEGFDYISPHLGADHLRKRSFSCLLIIQREISFKKIKKSAHEKISEKWSKTIKKNNLL